MPYIKDDEYRMLKDIEFRYRWLIQKAFDGASLNAKNPDKLYIRSGVLDEELRKYFPHDYTKKVKDLQANRYTYGGGTGKYGY